VSKLERPAAIPGTCLMCDQPTEVLFFCAKHAEWPDPLESTTTPPPPVVAPVDDRIARRMRNVHAARASLPAWTAGLDFSAGMPALRRHVRHAPALTAMRRIAMMPKLPGVITITGKPKAGKTSGASAFLHHLLNATLDLAVPAKRSEDASDMRYVDCVALAEHRRVHGLGRGHAPEMIEAYEAPLLVLDEVGDPRQWDVIQLVLWHRIHKSLPTIVGLSHVDTESLRAAFNHGGLERRLLIDAIVLPLDAPIAP
jgi:hypothetical protein